MTTRTPYLYRAARANGAIESGTIDAFDHDHASRELALKGLFPVQLVPRRLPSLARRMSVDDTALGLRLLADLVASGLTLKRAVSILEDVAPEGWRQALPAVRESIRRGEQVSDGLQHSGLGLDGMMLGMIRAGESAGQLAASLCRAAEFAEERARARSALVSALVYPAILATVGSLALAFLLVSVLPRFTDMIAETGRSLPPLTSGLVQISAFVQTWIVPITAVVTGLVVLTQIWRKTPVGRITWDRWVLRLPVVGSLRERQATARAASSLGNMLATGMTLPNALSIAAAGLGNAELANRLARATVSITEGTRIARALADHGAMTHVATRLIAAGEETGRLSEMLLHAGRLEADGVTRQVQRMMRLIEPGLILVFGSVVALVAAALLQAMYGVRVR